MSPGVEYNVTSGISLGDGSIAEFCRLKHPSMGKQCACVVAVVLCLSAAGRGFSGLPLAKNM
jgi:hypothetical protein